MPAATQDSQSADRLASLTGIPPDATEQEVTALARSKISDLFLTSRSEVDSKVLGQQVHGRISPDVLTGSGYCDTN